jgi:hypothetical protein
MKYIRHKKLGMIMFENAIAHSDMVSIVGAQRSDIQSAGFVVRMPGGGVECNGMSGSLNIESKPKDTEWVGFLLRY